MQDLKNLAPLSLRLILGISFVFHGFGKLFSSQGHEMFVGMLSGIGVPLPGVTAWLVGFVEFFGGLALLAGAAVAIVGGLQLIVMVVALITVHLPAGFSFMNIIGMTETGPQFGLPGYEVSLLFIAGLIALIVGGAGALSIDGLRAARLATVRAQGTGTQSADPASLGTATG